MSLIRYRPANLFDRFDNEINRHLFNPRSADATNQTRDWSPAVDIREEDSRYVLEADIPGVAREDLDITLEDSVLTIKGKRANKDEESREGYRRRERVLGTFVRQFSLPDTVNTEAISAVITDGVLEIGIPKQEKPEPRKITVN